MDTRNKEVISGQLECYPLRLHPGQEIYSSLLTFARDHNLTSAFILTCVGSVTKARLRMANSNTVKQCEGHFEIVSLVGTVSGGQAGHLHICLSDTEGEVIGGHVLGELVVYTTAEIMVGHIRGVSFSRPVDPGTGYDELQVDRVEGTPHSTDI